MYVVIHAAAVDKWAHWSYKRKWHKRYQGMLKAKGVKQSMSRKGNCLVNAVNDRRIKAKSRALHLLSTDTRPLRSLGSLFLSNF